MKEVTMFDMMGRKKCSNKNCADPVKPLGKFPKNKSSKDGHSHWCKDCHGNYRKSKKVKVVVVDMGDVGTIKMEPDVADVRAVAIGKPEMETDPTDT